MTAAGTTEPPSAESRNETLPSAGLIPRTNYLRVGRQQPLKISRNLSNAILEPQGEGPGLKKSVVLEPWGDLLESCGVQTLAVQV